MLLLNALLGLFLLGCRAGNESSGLTDSSQADGRGPSRPLATQATAPRDLPGLHNVIEVTPGVFSGSVPEGAAGFASLRQLGIRTVISVDGAAPEVTAARREGLRYVHLPVGYDGIPSDKQVQLARAVRDLPGPVYIHCHHGKHRSPAAAASVAVVLGRLEPDQAVALMKQAGTGSVYTGLYGCVAHAVAADVADLNAAPADYPEVAVVSDFVAAMVEIDERFEHLLLIQKAGWQVPEDHPDLVPGQEARRLAELFERSRGQHADRAGSELFRKHLEVSIGDARSLAEQLARPARETAALDARVTALRAGCQACHGQFRNPPPAPSGR